VLERAGLEGDEKIGDILAKVVSKAAVKILAGPLFELPAEILAKSLEATIGHFVSIPIDVGQGLNSVIYQNVVNIDNSAGGRLALYGPISGGVVIDSSGAQLFGDNVNLYDNTLNLTSADVSNSVIGSGAFRLDGNSTLELNVLSGESLTVPAYNNGQATITTLANAQSGLANGWNGIIGGSGALVIGNTGNANTVTLGGVNTYAGATTIDYGTLALAGAGAIAASSALIIKDDAVFDISQTSAGATVSLLQSQSGAVSGGQVELGGRNLTVNNNLNGSEFSGVISGTGGVIKQGADTLILSGANTYTGATTVRAGTLQIGNGGTTGSITGNILNNANVTFNRSDAMTYSGVISGPGNLTKNGSGALSLSGTNTYTGTTAVEAGTLALTGNGDISASKSVAVTGVLDISAITSGSATVNDLSGPGSVRLGSKDIIVNSVSGSEFSGLIDGAGGLQKTGPATWTLTSGQTYTGKTTIAGGVLALKDDGAISTSQSVTVNSVLDISAISDPTTTVKDLSGRGGVRLGSKDITVNSDTNSQFSGLIAGSGGVIKQGSAALTLAGVNIYTGLTSVNNGQLNITGHLGYNGWHQGNFEIASGGTLAFDQTVGQILAGTISGAGDLVKNGSGTLTLTNSSNTTKTTINAGKLRLENGSLGAVTVNSGATLDGFGQIKGDALISVGAYLAADGRLNFANDLSLASGSHIQFNNGGQVGVTGALMDSGAAYVASLDSLGFYVLASYGSGSFIGSGIDAPTILLNGQDIFGNPAYNIEMKKYDTQGKLVLIALPDGLEAKFWNGHASAAYWESASWAVDYVPTGPDGYWSDTTRAIAVFGADGATPSSITLNGDHSTHGLAFLEGGYVLKGADATLTLHPLLSDHPATIMVQNAGDTARIEARLASSARLQKAGYGTLVLNNDNPGLTGGVSVNGGYLQLDSRQAGGADGSDINIGGEGHLVLNYSDDRQAFAQTISGPGGLSIGEGRRVYLNTPNSGFSGSTTLEQRAVLRLGDNTDVRASAEAKALSEGFLSGLMLLNQGSELVAGRGLAEAVGAVERARAEQDQDDPAQRPLLVPFGALSGSRSRYNTGSHVDMSSLSLLAGFALGADLTPGHLAVGPFFEYGNGSYDTYNSFSHAASVHGDGHVYHLGGGLLGRLDFINTGPGHFYAEASGRAGGVYNKYSSGDLRDNQGRQAAYEASSAYYGLHLGAGYIWEITDAATLDLSGKYFWTRQKGDSVTLSTGEPVEFQVADSKRIRAGARFSYAVNEQVTPYLGAAWEHEFDGRVNASTYGYDIDRPSVRGDTGIGEIGLTLKPSPNLPLSFDLGLQGYVGKREGVTGSLQVKFEF
jgi:autotransporter-associated beta strand protein